MTLREVLEPFLPHDALPIVFESIAAIEALPGLGNWEPEIRSVLDASNLVHLGVPLFFVQRFPSLDPIREIIRNCLLNDRPLPAADLAELNLAAFCSAIQANNIEKIPRRDVRTPDFRVAWSDARFSEIEVVAGKVKTDHVERQYLAQTIAGDIGIGDRLFDIVVHCAASVTDRDITNIVVAAKQLKLGERKEESHKWEVRAEEIIGRDAYTIYVAGARDLPPSWWGVDVISSIAFQTVVGGPGETKPRPQTRIVTGLPARSYLNPVERKASRPQSTHAVFVIAFDVTDLPGAFEELKKSLPGYFQIWDHVAGVLAFRYHRYVGISRCGWTRKFYSNPLYTTEIPHELSSLDPTDDGISDTVCFLTERELAGFAATQD